MSASTHDEERHQGWRRNRASISGDDRGDERTRNRLPSPTNLLESSTRQNLRTGPQSPSQVNRARNYLGPTCPSYNKLDPLTSNQMSSRALLSKFLSQPDDDGRSGTWSDRYGSTAESSRSGSHPSFQDSSQFQRPGSSSWGSRDIGERRHLAQGSHEQERGRDEVHGSSNAPEPNMSRLQYSDIHSHDAGNNQASTSQGTSARAVDIQPIRLVNRYGEEEFR
ncbi:uncharacterized protein MELLADRAFT_111595 [Melampsora larici-populina 98AG31]|uniref:Uncharacterized protein n=1 Tax=Melampsora larici-populina (strain 98AG31 / pathotype 3-4-7) TaxID=747676 RepID=F4S3Q1_MELLP|nr:uncharacterized protein MELLADRAFT_111595 [Melampsora larici-populina 98AG31]EGG00757.1 hypothetical protein MELLADRAFT_111595 [Melampsora larici-populina 98AG31]